MDAVYADRLFGRKPVEYIHPALQPILEPTLGCLIFQEQPMAIAQQIAGFTGGEADDMRAAIGHKDEALMQSMKSKFIEGVVKHLAS
jgi:DNA polymerase-3 subunit alpha